MKKDGKSVLDRNFDKLEDKEKDMLLQIGENLLNIQGVINREKLSVVKKSKVKK
jgi:hypothetical protein